MRVLRSLALALVAGATVCPLQVASQIPQRPPNSLETLNKEAEATDSAGIHEYSQQLVRSLFLRVDIGSAYRNSFSDRLARAELMARHGKRKLISEAVIALAFNDLMKQTGAPDSLKADVAAVEDARGAFEKELPALISREKNGAYCNPGEAVFVLEMLIENVGRPRTPVLHSGPSVDGVAESPARALLMQYFSEHPRIENIEVFDVLAQTFGF